MILVQQINHNKNTKERKLTSGTKPLTNYFEKKSFVSGHDPITKESGFGCREITSLWGL